MNITVIHAKIVSITVDPDDSADIVDLFVINNVTPRKEKDIIQPSSKEILSCFVDDCTFSVGEYVEAMLYKNYNGIYITNLKKYFN